MLASSKPRGGLPLETATISGPDREYAKTSFFESVVRLKLTKSRRPCTPELGLRFSVVIDNAADGWRSDPGARRHDDPGTRWRNAAGARRHSWSRRWVIQGLAEATGRGKADTHTHTHTGPTSITPQ
jgi:hypothetical protein